MADTYTERAAAIRATQAARAADITNRRDLSDDGRKRQLAKIHADAKTAMQKLRQEAADDADKRRHDIMRQLFGDNDSHDSAGTMSNRDALDRADKITSAAQASQLLLQARITRDQKLARAVAAKALDKALEPTTGDGWVQVLNDWGGETPIRDNLLTELSTLEADSKPGTTTDMMRWALPRPAGLSNADQVDRLARDADQDPTDEDGIHTGVRASSWHD
jgi:hypothetical protein